MDPCNGDNEACNADGNCECDAGFVRDTISGDCVAGKYNVESIIGL